ncbi:hypothetical protein [uncultured Nostoc sp.]|uniref:hypothetical protein n=1 Tax=uncultured Nostoc sp. TaxID=340711 RepID=UPI0035CBCEC3
MANIKIAELQSSLFEEVSATDLDAVHGGQIPGTGTQIVGATSGVGVTFANGGSAAFSTESRSFLTGRPENFFLSFGTVSGGGTSPR